MILFRREKELTEMLKTTNTTLFKTCKLEDLQRQDMYLDYLDQLAAQKRQRATPVAAECATATSPRHPYRPVVILFKYC